MIALMPHPAHPDDPEQQVYMPFDYHHHSGEWTSIVGTEGFFISELDAAQSCHRHWLPIWRRIQELAGRVRAFCEHPKFARFEADGINAKMILRSVRKLTDSIELGDANILRLFSAPKSDDVIRVGDLLYRTDPETGVLQVIPELDDEEVPLSPDALFLRAIKQAHARVERITSRPVSPRGFQDALDLLRRKLQPDDDDREPIQYIADRRFIEWVAATVDEIHARTGQEVSVQGLEEAITVFRYWQVRLLAGEDRVPSLEELFRFEEPIPPSPDDLDGVVRSAINDMDSLDPDDLGDPDKLAEGTARHGMANDEPEDPDDTGP